MSTDTEFRMPRRFDWDEQYARAKSLTAVLQSRGVSCMIHADPNGVPACQIFTTDETTEYSRCLMMFTEGEKNIGNGLIAVEWGGQFSGYDPDFCDVGIQILERTWLGDVVQHVATAMQPFIAIIRKGGDAATGYRA